MRLEIVGEMLKNRNASNSNNRNNNGNESDEADTSVPEAVVTSTNSAYSHSNGLPNNSKGSTSSLNKSNSSSKRTSSPRNSNLVTTKANLNRQQQQHLGRYSSGSANTVENSTDNSSQSAAGTKGIGSNKGEGNADKSRPGLGSNVRRTKSPDAFSSVGSPGALKGGRSSGLTGGLSRGSSSDTGEGASPRAAISSGSRTRIFTASKRSASLSHGHLSSSGGSLGRSQELRKGSPTPSNSSGASTPSSGGGVYISPHCRHCTNLTQGGGRSRRRSAPSDQLKNSGKIGNSGGGRGEGGRNSSATTGANSSSGGQGQGSSSTGHPGGGGADNHQICSRHHYHSQSHSHQNNSTLAASNNRRHGSTGNASPAR